MKSTIHVNGMSCEHCVKRVTKACLGAEGVKDAVVSLVEKTAVLEHEGADLQEIVNKINELGFEASL